MYITKHRKSLYSWRRLLWTDMYRGDTLDPGRPYHVGWYTDGNSIFCF